MDDDPSHFEMTAWAYPEPVDEHCRSNESDPTRMNVISSSLPALVAHADWSIDARKRWMCVAALDGDGYVVSAAEPVGAGESLLERLRARAGGGNVFVGFDFPIGVPLAYARRAGVDSFVDLLPRLGCERWERFFAPAERAAEISLMRPFYPRRPGGTSRAQLVGALGVESFRDLLRRCERKTATRNDACSLFWTLGGNQVGRAAISGWREVLGPALRDRPGQVGLWPFQGDLREMLERFPCVVAETYPAEACVHLGLTAPGRGWSKRVSADRREQSRRVRQGVEGRLRLAPDLVAQIESGFGDDKSGEDPFDAFVGLVSMLDVVAGRRPAAPALADEVRRVEGWILGQEATGAL